ncbi:MAG: carbohydrate ABC transporter permease, partial [Chloroflexi bacterium]
MSFSITQDVRWQKSFWNVVATITLIIFLIFLLFPVFWMVLTAFKSNAEITRNELPFGIIEPTLSNFQLLFETTDFFRWVFNSVVVALTTTVFSVVVGTMAAYALVRLRFRGAKMIGLGVFVTYLLPQTLLFIPMAYVIQRLGLYNNLFSLIIVYPTMMVPFCTWLLMGY